MKRIYAREEYCMGCGLCEVYCAAAHSPFTDLVKAFKKSSSKPIARVIVERDGPYSFALQCRHCEDALCTKACITGAMHIDPATGLVLNDPSKCVGCWTCILVCPFGAIVKENNADHIAYKCDFCLDASEIPVCVKNCPNEALVLEDIDTSSAKEEKSCSM